MSNPYESPQAPESTEPEVVSDEHLQWQRSKNQQLLWMLLVSFIGGLLLGAIGDSRDSIRVIQFGSSVGIAILILNWCYYDRLRRNLRPWRFFTFMMVLVPGPILMVPLYLLASRGVRGFWSLLLAIGFAVVLTLVSTVGQAFLIGPEAFSL